MCVHVLTIIWDNCQENAHEVVSRLQQTNVDLIAQRNSLEASLNDLTGSPSLCECKFTDILKHAVYFIHTNVHESSKDCACKCRV